MTRAGLIIPVVIALSLAATAHVATQSGVNTSRSNIKNITFQLDGTKDSTEILSVEGGQLVPDITLFDIAPFQRLRQLGKPKIEELHLTMSANLSPSLIAWVEETLTGRIIKSRSGHMLLLDDAGGRGRIRFTEALITEIGLPALDAGAKEPAYLTIVLSPSSTTTDGTMAWPAGTSFSVTKPRVVIQKHWTPANFRIKFDDSRTGAVDGKKGLNAVNVKLARAANPGAPPAYELPPPHRLDTADLEFTTSRWANDPYAEDAARMLQGVAIDHDVVVDYLNDNNDLLFSVRRQLAVYKTTIETGGSGPDVMRVSMVANGQPIVITWPKK